MKSLQKSLVVLFVIAIGLGAAMLFRKQDADAQAGNASGAQAASVEEPSSEGDVPSARQTVPLPADAAPAGAADATGPPAPAIGDPGPAVTTPAEAIPPAQPTIRKPPVLPRGFPSFRPGNVVADAAGQVAPAEQPSAPAAESITAAPPRISPNHSAGNVDPVAPPPAAGNVAPPAPAPSRGALAPPPTRSANAVAPPPRPVEVSKPAASQPPPPIRTHRIVNGDTLARIARRYLGSADRGAEIFEFNRGVLADPQMLPLGRTIKIPPRDVAADADVAQTGGTLLPLPPLVPLPPGALARP